jgi:tRNA (cmo5U34)-methyltransferase
MRTPDQVPKQSWDEDDSRGFLALGNFAVPGREEQTAAICDLIPPCGGGSHLVELCCGEGALARALLERFPAAQVHGYDGSATMLDHARAALAGHGARFTTQQFDLADRSWRGFPWPVTAVVSSLAIHHLDGEGKRRLFADLCAGLAPGGALLIADLVRPASAAGVALAARAWDEAVRRRAPAASSLTSASAATAGTSMTIRSPIRSIGLRPCSSSCAGWRRPASSRWTSAGCSPAMRCSAAASRADRSRRPAAARRRSPPLAARAAAGFRFASSVVHEREIPP